MNKNFVLSNLQEAKEALEQIIHDLQKDPEYERETLLVDIAHVYHHINGLECAGTIRGASLKAN